MNIFEMIKEKCIYKQGIGRKSLGAFLEILEEVEEEYNNGWIPCSERLPEKEVDVLVCFSNDMDCVIAYRTKMMNTNLKDVWVNSSTAQIISSNITAWQPLPEPYKEEAEQALAEMKGV